MKTNDTQCHYAGFWIRFAAIWIDFLIVFLLLRIIMVFLEQFGAFDYFELIAILTIIAYISIFVGGKGRTIGKKLCGLTVLRINNNNVGYLRGLLREVVGKIISSIFFLGFLWILFSRSKRGWHDLVARTKVVKDTSVVKRARIIQIIVLMMNILLVGLASGTFLACSYNLQKRNILNPDAVDVSSLTKADHKPFVEYLKANGKPPIEYVVDKFKHHDVVILGEPHQIREVCTFITDLIDPLYHEAGVRLLAMEVFKYKNMMLANKLVTGELYDEELALKLLRDCGWPEWGFQEYIDILKAIWQVNHSLDPEAEKFRVICMESDWNGQVLRSGKPLWKLPGTIYKISIRDKFMAKVLDREVLKKGQKALVHIGAMHDFTRYRQPIVRNGKLIAEVPPRFGYILHENYGNQIFQVCLHRWGSWSEELREEKSDSDLQPLVSFLEDVFENNGNTPIGFDVNGSPFASLRDDQDFLFAYQKYNIFSNIAEGYVFLKPLDKLNRVTWAKGFVNEENFELFRDFLLRREWIDNEEKLSPEELNERMNQWHEETTK